MSAALAFRAGRAPLFLALGVFAGLSLPEFATAARNLLEPQILTHRGKIMGNVVVEIA